MIFVTKIDWQVQRVPKTQKDEKKRKSLDVGFIPCLTVRLATMKVLLVAVFVLAVVASVTATGVASGESKKAKCLVCEAMVQSVYDSASDAELIEASDIVPQLSRFGLSSNLVRWLSIKIFRLYFFSPCTIVLVLLISIFLWILDPWSDEANYRPH